MPSAGPVSLLRSRLESLLLVADEPTTAADFARLLGEPEEAVTAALTEISTEFSDRGMGFDLREREGAWRLYTRRENSATVEAKILAGAQPRLSRAALETLAVVAYRQPVTRSQVAAVRGVNCDGGMRTLTLRGLVKEVGVTGEVGGAHLYATTELFLEQLGIGSLDALPDLAPLLPEVDQIDLS
ncbi:SMC-Scp complex subunit ScpB [Corynebacterium neomassiliense]|uniref:SMC-Scp complex subunit ScpB n=1 Tax=Corynebacterium neomassiliense TaxID=2079482 RepID=UPI001030AB69|nr:SMC-Scp complex subunit ScpB [Corynebacterium neomassiliense]